MVDDDGRTAFSTAVQDLLYAEMLAEFHDTYVNAQDGRGMTALQWDCTTQRTLMIQLCLSVPDCHIGLRDEDSLVAFDIAANSGSEPIPNMLYRSIIQMEDDDPQAPLLRVLTITYASAHISRYHEVWPRPRK